jgi:type IV pilus assembly protein PilB
MMSNEHSMSLPGRVRAIARRAFPDAKNLDAIELDASIRSAWTQIAAAAGVDAWGLAKVIANELGLQVATDLGKSDAFAAQLVPEKLASEHLVLPLSVDGARLVVAAACPFPGGGLSRVQFVANRKLQVLVAPPEAIDEAIVTAYARVAEQQGGAVGTLRWSDEGEPFAGGDVEQSAIVRLSRSLLLEAIETRASDLHLQPFAGGGIARTRVDGILRRVAIFPAPVLKAITRFFKAQGGMDPTNDRTAQDGRMSLVLGRADYDLRLSVLPASRGERLVIRILDQGRVHQLSGSGLSKAAMLTLRRLLGRTSGLLLLTGPTGSGKTSTLYSMLAEINSVGVSIITVENPVEYRIAGISQVEVNPKAGLTFASSLRSILRQDPDVVLIGEIRDAETAEIAMQAALTGHLVLSTLHTNDAITAVPRLIDLGVHPSVVADAVAAVLAQRLLRRLCEACRKPVSGDLLLEERLFQQLTGELPRFRASGCEACRRTGYLGRFPVCEIVEMTPELASVIAREHGDLSKLREAARGPLASLAVAAMNRVISGDTTAGEAARVIGQRFWTDMARESGRSVPAGTLAALQSAERQQSGIGVVLFESNPVERQANAEALQAAGVNVHATDDIDDSRRILETQDDVVLLIVDLDAGHGQDNVELMKRLRGAMAWARLPVLVILPESDERLRALLEAHGVADYLVKPLTPQEIVDRARAVLAR